MTNMPHTPKMIFSSDGFTPHVDLIIHAEEKVDKLHRHANPRIGAVRVRIARETSRFDAPRFAACLIAHRSGADCVAHGFASEPIAAMDDAFRKMERLISAVTSERAHARHHPHPVEFDVALPKTCT